VNNKIDTLQFLREKQAADIKELVYLESNENLMQYTETPTLIHEAQRFYETHNPVSLELLPHGHKNSSNNSSNNNHQAPVSVYHQGGVNREVNAGPVPGHASGNHGPVPGYVSSNHGGSVNSTGQGTVHQNVDPLTQQYLLIRNQQMGQMGAYPNTQLLQYNRLIQQHYQRNQLYQLQHQQYSQHPPYQANIPQHQQYSQQPQQYQFSYQYPMQGQGSNPYSPTMVVRAYNITVPTTEQKPATSNSIIHSPTLPQPVLSPIKTESSRETKYTPIKQSPTETTSSGSITFSKSALERVKKEAAILKKHADYKKNGRVGPSMLGYGQIKDYRSHLLDEVVTNATKMQDQRDEKIHRCKKISKAVLKWHEESKKEEKRQQKEAKQEIFRVAKWISREVKIFWGQIGVLVKHKQQRKLDEKRQQVLNEHLDFLVDQTQKYATMLARDLVTPKVENDRVKKEEVSEDSNEFANAMEDKDDEMTLLADEEALKKEEQNGNINETEQLEKDSEIPIEELRKMYDYHPPVNIIVEKPEVSDRNDTDNIFTNDNDIMKTAAEAASKIQPTGYTLTTTNVKTPIPFLLKYSLREYQHVGLDWLVCSNGID